MTLAAISKVEDAIAEALRASLDFADWVIITDQPADVAVEWEDAKAIVIYTTAYGQEQADEQGQTLHTAMIEFEVISGDMTVGIIGRANHLAIAHIIAALAPDRTIGGRLQDLQERDVAAAAANGKSVGTASLQMQATFFTPRNDWTVIIGPGGATF